MRSLKLASLFLVFVIEIKVSKKGMLFIFQYINYVIQKEKGVDVMKNVKKILLALVCFTAINSVAVAEGIEDGSSVSEEVIAGQSGDQNFDFRWKARGGKKFENVDTYDFLNETQVAGLRGFAEIGVDVYDFENKVKQKSFAEPYFKFEVNPISGTNIYVDGKFGQRYQYNRESSRQDNRESYELYLGNIYSSGKFFFNYKFGVRHQEFDTGDYLGKKNPVTGAWLAANGSLESRTEYRVIPRMSYTFNDEWSWFLRGYMAWVEAELASKAVANSGGGAGSGGGGGNNPPKYTGVLKEGNYSHRLESGVAYKYNEDLRFVLSGISAVTGGSYAQEEIDWLGLGKVEYRVTNSKNLLSEAYLWAFWMPEVTTKAGGKENNFHNESAYRLGYKAEWEFAPDWTLRPEVFAVYFKKNAGGGTGSGGGGGQGQKAPSRQWEFEMVYRLGLRYYF